MKKSLLSLFAIALAVACTEPYDDTDLQAKVAGLDSRVTTLESTCQTLNSTIEGVNQALDQKYTVASVTPTENGYSIKFTNNEVITISNGANGAQGPQGPAGPAGAAGATGPAPQIGVVLEGGAYFWTVEGKALTDANGNKIKASADAPIAPKFKVEGTKWMVSTDNGTSWQEVEGASAASSVEVTEDADNVYIKFADGSTVTLPKESGFKLNIEKENMGIKVEEVTEIPYTVAKADESTKVFVEACGIEASVAAVDAASGVIKVKTGETVPEGSYIIVKAVKNSTQELSVKYITFEEQFEGYLAIATTAYEVPAEGGTVNVIATTNSACVVSVPEEVTWLRYVATKANHDETLEFVAEPSTYGSRTATVTVSAKGVEPMSITFVQAAPVVAEKVLGVVDSWSFRASSKDAFKADQPNWIVYENTTPPVFSDPTKENERTLLSVSGKNKAVWYCAMRPDAPMQSYYRTTFHNSGTKGPAVNGVWWDDGLKFYVNNVTAKAGQKIEFMIGLNPVTGQLISSFGVKYSFDGGKTFTDSSCSVYVQAVLTESGRLTYNKGNELFTEIPVDKDMKNNEVIVFLYAIPGQEYVSASSGIFVMPEIDDPKCTAINATLKFTIVSKPHKGEAIDGATFTLTE